jgi:SAM-dependent methyltransferase
MSDDAVPPRSLNPSESFGADFSDLAEVLGRYAETAAEVDGLVRLLAVAPGAHVLDVPCGFGRFAGPLHQRGFRVTGIDFSPDQIALAGARNPGPEYVVGDMAQPPPGPYDALINTFTSFGYGATPDDDARVLRAWHEVLAPGGVLVMETADLERARTLLGGDASRAPDGPGARNVVGDVEERQSVDWDAHVLINRYRAGERYLELRTRLYTREQLVYMLNGAGFGEVQCYGGFDAHPKRPEDRLVVRAVRL